MERDEAIKAWARAQVEFARVHDTGDQVTVAEALAAVDKTEAELYRLAGVPDPWPADVRSGVVEPPSGLREMEVTVTFHGRADGESVEP